MPSSLTREDKDALAIPGVRTVVLTDVINDIQQTPHQYNPAAIIAGLKFFVAKAHRKDVKVIGTTIPPYGGFERYETAGEICRQAVNAAIRTNELFQRFPPRLAIRRESATQHPPVANRTARSRLNRSAGHVGA
ncbi:hypothetical protein GCM10009804_72250 [Kribbella hippodromi]|uniref:Uncharacterized protein n=1 Tax=Kribbella hippodromi TaxID=434347 RepID=A0ABN2EFW5_9ACTN